MDKNRIEGAAKNWGGKLQGSFGEAVGSDRNAAEGRLRQAEGTAQNLYGEGRDALREATHEASKYAASLYENAGSYAQEGQKVMRRKVHDNPLSALLVAGLVGLFLGLTLRDRH
ncbi:CsbD family protein [Aureimonas sp. AU40]|uniref:CsbD family protein n=1 Tax=Aureimonas sp. AU40 TaxID=1637747 RepID=UPI0007863F21|nr:CsbD family protein [Aureimonas sp. AU40]